MAKGKERKLIVIVGSLGGRAVAEKTYEHPTADFETLWKESANFYRDYLENGHAGLPDKQLEKAYGTAGIVG